MQRRARLLWLAAIAWVLTIYSTLYVARSATEFLRERNLLRLTVAAVFVAVAAVFFWTVGRRRPGWRELAVLVAVGVVVLVAALQLQQVEERLHIVEYGVLALLLFQALEASKVPAPAWIAAFATFALGWLDEGIQYLLPNRHYGLHDVAINAVAGVGALLALKALRWARARDAASPARSSI